MTFIVGLTGGIGSGKSTVADLLVRRGAALVDTDAIAHALTTPRGAAMATIAAAFGPTVLQADGGLDRAAMRDLVFADPGAKTRLEAILHPLIRRHSEDACRAQSASPYVVLAVPLLVESGFYRQYVDRVLVIDCDEATQRVRVMARSGLTAEQVAAIIRTQARRDQRLSVADDVVRNDGPVEDLGPQIDRLHQRYLALAAAKKPIDR